MSSAALWLLGEVFLLVALTGRATNGRAYASLWSRRHDVAVALACLLIAAVAWSLRGWKTRSGEALGPRIAWLGMISGLATSLLLLLVLLTGASDMVYMLSQGGVGLWLIAVCAKKPEGLGSGVRALGFVAGTGLLLIALGFVLIAFALGPALVTLIEARSVPVNPADVASPLNSIGHLVLKVGSLLGLPTYPIWALLVSRSDAS